MILCFSIIIITASNGDFGEGKRRSTYSFPMGCEAAMEMGRLSFSERYKISWNKHTHKYMMIIVYASLWRHCFKVHGRKKIFSGNFGSWITSKSLNFFVVANVGFNYRRYCNTKALKILFVHRAYVCTFVNWYNYAIEKGYKYKSLTLIEVAVKIIVFSATLNI